MCGGREEGGDAKKTRGLISLLDRGMEKFRSVGYLPPLIPHPRRDFHALIQEIRKCRIGFPRYHDSN